jgi:sialic acid synthase SpsE
MRLEIAGRRIAAAAPVFAIAEIGLNHGGSPDRALAMVDAAAAAGASAIKLQTIAADRLVLPQAPAPAHVGGRVAARLLPHLRVGLGGAQRGGVARPAVSAWPS